MKKLLLLIALTGTLDVTSQTTVAGGGGNVGTGNGNNNPYGCTLNTGCCLNASPPSSSNVVSFTANPPAGLGYLTAFSWDFGDGTSTSNNAYTITHSYGPGSGSYTAKVYATDGTGSICWTNSYYVSISAIMNNVPCCTLNQTTFEYTHNSDDSYKAKHSFTTKRWAGVISAEIAPLKRVVYIPSLGTEIYWFWFDATYVDVRGEYYTKDDYGKNCGTPNSAYMDGNKNNQGAFYNTADVIHEAGSSALFFETATTDPNTGDILTGMISKGTYPLTSSDPSSSNTLHTTCP